MVQWLWTQRSDFGPSARTWAALAYNSKSKCTVLAGGINLRNEKLLNDTWQWDGSAWAQVSDIGPAVQTFALTYIPVRDQLVLLAATPSTTGQLHPCQTWIWDGQEWTQVAELGPVNPSMCTYDQNRDRIVVLTSDYQTTAQTWEWDGGSWTQVEDSGPPPRMFGALAHDASREQCVLFGGYDLTGNSVGDTWAWDGNAWHQLATFGPAPRNDFGMVYDSARKCMVLFGGIQNSQQEATALPNQTWEWDGKRWTERQDIGPSSRLDPGMAFDSARNRVVLFGGSNGSTETWEYMEWPPAAVPPG